MRRRVVSEALFWTHLFIIVFAVFVGLIFPLWTVVIMASLHRVHTWIFKGCVFSKLERRWGSLDQQSDFLMHMVKRLFGYQLTPVSSKRLDYGLLAVSLGIALTNYAVSEGLLTLGQLAALFSSMLGLAVSLTITKQYKRPKLSICYIGSKCNLVLESKYAQVGGIKLSILGTIFYAFCIIILTLSFWTPGISNLMLWISISGGLASICLVALQAFVIRAYCQYCLVSASSAVVILVSSFNL